MRLTLWQGFEVSFSLSLKAPESGVGPRNPGPLFVEGAEDAFTRV